MKMFIVLGVLVTVFASACRSAEQADVPVPGGAVTEQIANGVLTRVIEGIAAEGLADYCKHFSYDTHACDDAMNSALARCLVPADKPKVADSAAVDAKTNTNGGHTRGGWVLRLSGRTMDGQRYLSDFFVTKDDEGRAVASIPVFWTGIGLSDAPFSANSTKTPQNACPGRS